MSIFTVHIPRAFKGSDEQLAETAVFVADKFCWPALLFGPFWLIWHAMWWVLAGFVVASALLPALAGLTGTGAVASVWIGLAGLLLFAAEAASLRRWSLAMKGYKPVAVISGRDREDCERSFYRGWSSSAEPETRLPSRPVAAPGPAPSPAMPESARSEPGVIGVFPTPGANS